MRLVPNSRVVHRHLIVLVYTLSLQPYRRKNQKHIHIHIHIHIHLHIHIHVHVHIHIHVHTCIDTHDCTIFVIHHHNVLSLAAHAAPKNIHQYMHRVGMGPNLCLPLSLVHHLAA